MKTLMIAASAVLISFSALAPVVSNASPIPQHGEQYRR